MTRPAVLRFLVLIGVSLGAVLMSCFIGPAEIGVGDAIAGFFGADAIATIIREVRLPRALAAWLAGAALGAAGATLQGLLRNPLADPGVLGVSSMAALGAVIAIYFNLAAAAFWLTPAFAIAFALGATALLYALGAARLGTTSLILVGVGLSSFSGALIALVMNLAPNPFVLSDLVNWLFGAVANRSFADLALVLPVMAAGFAIALSAARGLSALSLGEDVAETLGADVATTRMLAIAGAALLTGGAVALAGVIGFVGIVAPHLARPLVGYDPGRAILPAALVGGATLAVADLVVRLLPFDQELKLGVVAALIGAPAFVFIAARARGIAT
jgi:iron complex transport system permease protein